MPACVSNIAWAMCLVCHPLHRFGFPDTNTVSNTIAGAQPTGDTTFTTKHAVLCYQHGRTVHQITCETLGPQSHLRGHR